MKVECIKLAGGVLSPVNDDEADKLKRFSNGEQYQVELKLTRNPSFHRKVFSFFNFCFAHWCADMAGFENLDRDAQFNTFRNHLTVLAGFYEKTFKIDGSVRVEAKSLAFANMNQDEFESCFSSLINAAIKHIFNGTKDENIIGQLRDYF